MTDAWCDPGCDPGCDDGAPAILLLAAGRGQRFGGDKLVARLADGTPLVLASAYPLLVAGGRMLAVVRQPGQGAAALLAGLPGVRVCACPAAAAGIGHSIACGVAASPAASGWLIALADMPRIRPATVGALLASLTAGADLVAPCYQGRRGHPVGFSARWRDALLALRGDRGARDLLAATALTRLELDDPGVLLDIDRPQDLSVDKGLASPKQRQ